MKSMKINVEIVEINPVYDREAYESRPPFREPRYRCLVAKIITRWDYPF